MNKAESLESIKDEVQKILDRHLKPEERFSVQDCDENTIYLLIDLLLEKDDKKRKKIREKIEKEIINIHSNIDQTYNSILEIQDKIAFQKDEVKNINNLKNTINAENELDNELSVL
jgi:hypothetical protein